MANNIAKLTDFGLSVFEGQLSKVYKSHRGGAYHWLAPEILKPELFNVVTQRPTKKSDVYSFAMVCYEVLRSLCTNLISLRADNVSLRSTHANIPSVNLLIHRL